MTFLRDLWGFLVRRKRFWLVPIILVLLAFGAILALGSTAIAPFVYTLF